RNIEHVTHDVQFETCVENDETCFFEMRLILFYQLRVLAAEYSLTKQDYDSYFAVSTSDMRFTISPPTPKLSRMIFPCSSSPTMDIKRVFSKPSLSSASATFRPTPPQLRLLRPVCVLPSFWK
ncbi:hypothetical protein ALC57_09987, partial [Trachymyrmex cornetzi]